MIEQIKQALERESDDFQLTAPRLRKHVYDLIGEVERLSKCQSCGGVGYVELSHDPYMTSPCECVIFEQAVEDYPKLKLRNAELEKALKNIRTHYVSVHDEDWKKAYDEIWYMAFLPKEGETK